MTIDEMQAGPELDVLIHSKVLGLNDFLHNFIDNGWGQCSECGAYNDQGIIRGEQNCTKPPPYSSDIGITWQIVKKAQIHTLRQICNDEVGAPALWEAIIYLDPRLSGIGESAPLAICRAALKSGLRSGLRADFTTT